MYMLTVICINKEDKLMGFMVSENDCISDEISGIQNIKDVTTAGNPNIKSFFIVFLPPGILTNILI